MAGEYDARESCRTEPDESHPAETGNPKGRVDLAHLVHVHEGVQGAQVDAGIVPSRATWAGVPAVSCTGLPLTMTSSVPPSGPPSRSVTCSWSTGTWIGRARPRRGERVASRALS